MDCFVALVFVKTLTHTYMFTKYSVCQTYYKGYSVTTWRVERQVGFKGEITQYLLDRSVSSSSSAAGWGPRGGALFGGRLMEAIGPGFFPRFCLSRPTGFHSSPLIAAFSHKTKKSKLKLIDYYYIFEKPKDIRTAHKPQIWSWRSHPEAFTLSYFISNAGCLALQPCKGRPVSSLQMVLGLYFIMLSATVQNEMFMSTRVKHQSS